MKCNSISSRYYNRILNGIILVSTFCFLLLFLELGFRIFRFFQTDSTANKQLEFIELLAVPDSYGIVRPHVHLELRDYFPTGQLIDYPVPVSTNAYGMRMREVNLKVPQNTIRIAAMGDSCTFGWMVPEKDSYPRQLEKLLNEKNEQHYEVLNFGVPGYTSFHGLKQYHRLVKQFRPDVLILAFGFNDSFESRFSEKEFYSWLEKYNLTKGLSGLPLFLYDHSVFGKWLIRRLHSSSRTIIEEEVRKRAQKGVWCAKASRQEYKTNLRKIITDARTYNARCLLLHLNLPNTWVKKPLSELAAEMDTAFYDVQDFFKKNKSTEYINRANKLGLIPSGMQHEIAEEVFTLVFRVEIPQTEVVPDKIYIVGNHKVIGDWSPNTVAMYDDGTHGDEKAGDRIWSLTVQIKEPIMLDYTFTNSGPLGQWIEAERLHENPDKAIRYYAHIDLSTITPGSVWYSPIHRFGEIPYDHLLIPGDPIHPNKIGYKLIAEQILPHVVQISSLY